MKLRVKGSLFHCGACRKSYSNPFGHVCVTRLDRPAPTGRTRLAPTVGVSAGTCPRCGKPRGNPATHVCTVRTDFKRRKADTGKQEAAGKRRQAASLRKIGRARQQPARPQPHTYQACRDEDCPRAACTAYRDGRATGYEEGYADAMDTAKAGG